ncbi:hypothetical protein QQP08_015049 [Theobroma cacao]|nr:hypothetical protein QQP08_015049 [Theobroma cacao]
MNLQATTTNIAVQVNKLKCETQQLNKEELMQQQSSTEPTMKQLQFGLGDCAELQCSNCR